MRAKNIQLGIGSSFFPGKESVQATKGNELECVALGVLATSGKTGRRILIPYSNVRAIELMPEVSEPVKVPAKSDRKAKADVTA